MPKTLFTPLVENAFDFLHRSIDEFNKSPKFSIVLFFTSMELFLKARLVHEHWTLIYNKPDLADIKKFQTGDFQSIGAGAILSRIEKVTDEKFSRSEKRVFENLKDIRNRVVHFFDADVTGEKRVEAASTELQAWLIMHKLLSEKWGDVFKNHKAEIDKAHLHMAQVKGFLRHKYDLVKDDISSKKENGAHIYDCFSCGFPSLEVLSAQPLKYDESFEQVHCHVCDVSTKCLIVPCPECGNKRVEFTGDMWVTICTKCQDFVVLKEYLAKYQPHISSVMDGVVGRCSECFEEAVVPYDKGGICLFCLEEFKTLGFCQSCGELVGAQELYDSFFEGCAFCDGQKGKTEER